MELTIDEKQTRLVKRFSEMNDWLERYEHLIQLGRSLPQMDETLRTPERSLPGCEARVWVDIEIQDGRVRYEADSDSLIVRGLIALLISVLDGHSPEEITGAALFFIREIGLDTSLSPSRANGLSNLVRKMQALSP